MRIDNIMTSSLSYDCQWLKSQFMEVKTFLTSHTSVYQNHVLDITFLYFIVENIKHRSSHYIFSYPRLQFYFSINMTIIFTRELPMKLQHTIFSINSTDYVHNYNINNYYCVIQKRNCVIIICNVSLITIQYYV